MSKKKIVKFIAVIFGAGSMGVFEFKSDLDLAVGDTVVCDTKGSWLVGEVVGVNDLPDFKEYHRWIIQKVDVLAHTDRLDRIERHRELETKMELRARELERLAKYKYLSNEDTEMSDMLTEYLVLDI